MADEIEERGLLAVFLSHEDQGHKRAEKNRPGRELEALEPNERREALAEHAVPHLIVVLREDDEALAR